MGSKRFTYWVIDHAIPSALAFFVLLVVVQSAVAPLQGARAFPSLKEVVLRAAPWAIFWLTMVKLYGPRWKRDADSLR